MTSEPITRDHIVNHDIKAQVSTTTVETIQLADISVRYSVNDNYIRHIMVN